MQNLLCLDYEKILLLTAVIFRGDFHTNSSLNCHDIDRLNVGERPENR
jgi:hypothetical protein